MDEARRRIACRTHNKYVETGPPLHRETTIAPTALLGHIDEALQKTIEDREKVTVSLLRRFLGEPYYSDRGFILYNADCLSSLEQMNKASLAVDLTLTSPPYNIGKEYEEPLSVERYVEWCAHWMTKIHDVTTPKGSFWLNIGYLEVPGKGLCVPIPYLLWDKSSFYLLQEVVWTYGAGVSAKRRLSPRNEKWLWFINDPNEYIFNLDDIRDPNVKYPHQKKNGKFRCNPIGKNPSDVWEIPKVTSGKDRSSKERTGHPAQFPLRVVERIIRASSRPTDIVLDPFAGSCSAGLAAVALGRLFVGVEAREDYCRIAVDRHNRYKEESALALQQAVLF